MTYRTYRNPTRTAARRTRSPIRAASVVVGPVLIGLVASLIGLAASPVDILHGDAAPTVTGVDSVQPTMEDRDQRDDRDRRDRRASAIPLGEEDGVIPDGVTVTVFDDDVPAVANLDPDLLGALRQAAADASDDGVEFLVNSGWRSPEYQEELFREAVAEYGSEEEAAR
jgi:D-alanyl-D-alanine carboxypeptidase